ncbi:MAG: hypothetical protein HQ471_07700 [Flavobacteriales bacterium]|nr:hypothetical protein [Flavobacteriales bacterium]
MKTAQNFLENNQEHLNSYFAFLNTRNLQPTKENMLDWVNSTAKKMKKLSENNMFMNKMYENYNKINNNL